MDLHFRWDNVKNGSPGQKIIHKQTFFKSFKNNLFEHLPQVNSAFCVRCLTTLELKAVDHVPFTNLQAGKRKKNKLVLYLFCLQGMS